MMQIVVNGDSTQMPESATLHGLLEKMQLAQSKIAVELNQNIVPRSEYGSCVLRNGDRIEIVQAIGGG